MIPSGREVAAMRRRKFNPERVEWHPEDGNEVVWHPDGPQSARKAAHAELIPMENLAMQTTNWIWNGWLARGAIHLIAGAPEAGKTTCALALAAVQSAGGRWPDRTKAEPGNVLIWTGEDDPARTFKPRLVAMGADAKKIWIVKAMRDEYGKARPFNPATDLPALELAAQQIAGGVDLLIIDPIVSVVGGKVDNGNNAGHREKLRPLVDFGERFKCAIIGITHFTKGTVGKDPIDRVTGSLAFGAVARVIFVATKNKSGEPERIFIMAKNNLAPISDAFGYLITGGPLPDRPEITASRIVWGEQLEGTARDLLAEAEDDGSGKDSPKAAGLNVKAFLKEALANGERPQKDIAAEGEARGFSRTRLFRASNDLGVVKRKEGFGHDGEWL
jgi:putative DNA primase/helicase